MPWAVIDLVQSQSISMRLSQLSCVYAYVHGVCVCTHVCVCVWGRALSAKVARYRWVERVVGLGVFAWGFAVESGTLTIQHSPPP